MKDLINFLKAASVFVLGFMAIISAAGVWNGVASGAISSFYGWVAFFNLAFEGWAIYLYQDLVDAFGVKARAKEREEAEAKKKNEKK